MGSWCNTIKVDKLRCYLAWWKYASCICLASRLFVLCLLCCPNHLLVQGNAPLHGARQHVHILNKSTDDCYLSFTFLCQLGRCGCPGTSVLQMENIYRFLHSEIRNFRKRGACMVEFSMFFSFELQKIPDMWRCLSIIACPQWSMRSWDVFSVLTFWTGGSSEKKESKLCKEGRWTEWNGDGTMKKQ